MPPPTKKNQDTNFPAVRGVSRFFLSGHPPKPQQECVPKIWGRPPRKKSGHHSSRSFEACPDFFSGHPLKPQRERVPKISCNPPLRGRVQGAEGLQVFSGAVFSGQLKYAVRIPRNFPMLRQET